jgi:hypothetical protein
MKPLAMNLYIEAVGCCAPGLDGWAQARRVLRGECPYLREELPAHAPARLPANERRRSTLAVRLAFRVAEDALSAGGSRADALATVFASSDGDTHIVHRLCMALAEPQRVVSPTDFHNSVHNAASGYWSIAANAKMPSTSLSAGNATFAAGLLEAAALVKVEGHGCLFVGFDVRPPQTLLARCDVEESGAFALILSPRRTAAALAELRVATVQCGPETRMEDAALESLRLSTPAARALPLLQLLAHCASGTVLLDGAGGQSVRLELSP